MKFLWSTFDLCTPKSTILDFDEICTKDSPHGVDEQEKKIFQKYWKLWILEPIKNSKKFRKITKNSKNIDFWENFIESNRFRIVFYAYISIFSRIGENFWFSKIFKIRKKIEILSFDKKDAHIRNQRVKSYKISEKTKKKIWCTFLKVRGRGLSVGI